MKRLAIFLLFISFRQGISQTYVLIPDSNFATKLQAVVPSAMSGNSLNITSTVVTSATQTLIVNFLNIANIEGVQYFTSLKFLNCSGNTFTSLPTLPNTIQELYCGSNPSLTILPNIPNSLVLLNCISSILVNLPPLSTSLQSLICSFSSLSTLPSLPNSLKLLDCQSNPLTVLPQLPPFLEYLYCANSQLVNLPSLPNSLKFIHCPNNSLTTLPSLPTSLTDLDCSSNSISAMPHLPDSLKGLVCSNNSLINLPTLPNSLIALFCNDNTLTNLPSLPNTLGWLWAQKNNIKCFPVFPTSIAFFNIANNPFNCLPNYIPNMSPTLMAVPLCTIGNTNGCSPVWIGEEKNSESNILIHPNPSKGILSVETNSKENQTIQIIDISGKLLLEQVINNSSTIDATNLTSGIYVVTIKTSNYAINKKFILIH